MGTWVLTHKAKAFDFAKPDASMICIEDIEHSLGKLVRFNGHLDTDMTKNYAPPNYTVLSHVKVCYMLAQFFGFSLETQFLCLTHDYTEAYIGDIPAPLKNLIPDISEVERSVDEAILDHINVFTKEELKEEHYKQLKFIDYLVLFLEVGEFMSEEQQEKFPEPFTEQLKNAVHSLSDHYGWMALTNHRFASFKHLIGGLVEDSLHDLHILIHQKKNMRAKIFEGGK